MAVGAGSDHLRGLLLGLSEHLVTAGITGCTGSPRSCPALGSLTRTADIIIGLLLLMLSHGLRGASAGPGKRSPACWPSACVHPRRRHSGHPDPATSIAEFVAILLLVLLIAFRRRVLRGR